MRKDCIIYNIMHLLCLHSSRLDQCFSNGGMHAGQGTLKDCRGYMVHEQIKTLVMNIGYCKIILPHENE